MPFQEVANGIYMLEGKIPGVDNIFTTYLIWEGAIIEPGPAAFAASIEPALMEMGFNPTLISVIIPTHIHLDHGGGAGYMAQLYPRAKILVHPDGANHFIDPSRLIASTKMAFGEDFEKVYGPILPIAERQVYTPQDGEKIDIGGRELQIFYAPGHAPHHLVIFDLDTKGLFCGEALGVPQGESGFPIPYAAPPSFDLEAYLQTMEKLKALSPRILFYSHNRVGTDPEKLISMAQETSRKVGEVILEALRAGEDQNKIQERVKDYVIKAGGTVEVSSMVGMTVAGYIHYFQKKGLIR